MNKFYTTTLLTLFICYNQLDASNPKVSDILLLTHKAALGFEQLVAEESQARNQIHADVAHAERLGIIELIRSKIDLTDILNDTNEQGHLPYDQAKLGAMNRYWFVETRKEYYKICDIFKEINAPSWVTLFPQPTDEQMKLEYEQAMASIVTPKPSKRDHLKKP